MEHGRRPATADSQIRPLDTARKVRFSFLAYSHCSFVFLMALGGRFDLYAIGVQECEFVPREGRTPEADWFDSGTVNHTASR